MSDEHPYLAFPGTDAETFIQWKGTDVCIDVYCRCEEQFHIDGFFAHFVECPYCHTVYQMGTQVKLVAVDRSAAYIEPILGDDDDDDVPMSPPSGGPV